MGCDIHSYAERKDESGKYVDLDFSPFDNRSYGTFGFLADVRNYSAVPPISQPRGLPDDVSSEVPERDETWGSDGHSHSWLSVAELVSFDYDSAMEDRRHTVQTGPRSWNGGATCEVGQGKKKTTFRKFLGDGFFADLKKLQDMGAERVVFWFES